MEPSYNISVIKPEEDDPFANALQFQPTGIVYGHHDGTPSCPEDHLVPSGQNGYSFPQISASGLPDNPYHTRPPVLPHLTTRLSQPVAVMPSNGTTGPDNVHQQYSNASRLTQPHQSTFHTPTVQHAWTMGNDHFDSQSNLLSGSPLSQGYSPLTPNTPLSTIERSPLASSLPSPGSQGSNEVLHLAPSPAPSSSTMTVLPDEFSNMQLANQHYRQHGSETHLSTLPPLPHSPHVLQQFDNYVANTSQMNVLVRRHSHSALERPLQRTVSASTYSPYPVPSSAPERSASVRSDRNRSFTDVTLVARPEYIWEGYCLPGPLVPQQQYQPHTASDRRRYVEQAELQPPIYFKRVEPVELGISLVDCLAQRFKRLQGYDDELLQDAGPSISIRLNWEGYDPWSRQIPTRNFKVPQGPITRKVLAKNIAKTVQRFIDEHIDRQLLPNSNPTWQVGPGRIEFNDVVLLSIHHVSRGSWQANLCLNQPLEAILSRSMQSAYHT